MLWNKYARQLMKTIKLTEYAGENGKIEKKRHRYVMHKKTRKVLYLT